ncbi:MAG: iron-only hydrogenase system regulator [Clostridia bacterium]|nr:iron-only hydrogenase system regulator [Clostridia bacterium]MBR2884074.1 iron-only hydrogenase system regulator [Clostridia bacterium]
MESRVALIAIIVEAPEKAVEVNEILHEYGDFIIGRMGIPYRQKGVNIISIAIDAPQEVISALSGKIGKIENVNVKTAFSNIITKDEDWL